MKHQHHPGINIKSTKDSEKHSTKKLEQINL